MWLLNVETYELKSFFEDKLPAYAILSHTWGEGEVTFRDMIESRYHDKPGFKKIQLCCAQALRDTFEWVWIDTCCIDKSSSAELSEAINSMYRWYKGSTTCYAYLSDVHTVPITEVGDGLYGEQCFTSSRWFSRGWTLQELLAPSEVAFYNSSWRLIGYRSDLAKVIASSTSIPEEALRGFRPRDWRVCSKMSWYGQRQTTRLEDCAYSLLGIFDVNMPLLYGEGCKAFERLQELIFESTKDMTIFSWDSCKPEDTGLLASSPASFSRCRDRKFKDGTTKALDQFRESCSVSLTKTSFEISTELRPFGMNIFLIHISDYRVDRRVSWHPYEYFHDMEEYMYVQQINPTVFRRIPRRKELLFTRRKTQPRPIGFGLLQGYKFDVNVLRTKGSGIEPLTLLKPFPHVSNIDIGEGSGMYSISAGIYDMRKGLRRVSSSEKTHLGVREHLIRRTEPGKNQYDCLFFPVSAHTVKVIFLLQKPVVLECGLRILDSGLETSTDRWIDVMWSSSSGLLSTKDYKVLQYPKQFLNKCRDVWHVSQLHNGLVSMRLAIDKAANDGDYIKEAPLFTIAYSLNLLLIQVKADFIVCETRLSSPDNRLISTKDRWIYFGHDAMQRSPYQVIEK